MMRIFFSLTSRHATEITNATHNPTHRRQNGFTLLEILVVIVIVGVMAGMTLLSAPTFLHFRDFEGEARRVELLLNSLRDESIIQGSEFGFNVETDGDGGVASDRYVFYRFDDRSAAWEEWSEDPFRAYTLPEDLRMTLTDTPPKSDKGKQNRPPVILFSDGSMTPFTLSFEDVLSERRMELISDNYVDLRWQTSWEDDGE